MEPRLRAEIWVKAHIRRCAALDLPAFVLRRGDGSAGSVLIKVNRFDLGCIVLSPSWRGDGCRVWLRATGEVPVAEADADAYIARSLSRDPDVWVIEVEDRHGRHALDEPID